jgi:hypothetical protein
LSVAGAGEQPGDRLLGIPLLVTLAIAVPIAVLDPFDRTFAAITLGLPWLRAVTVTTMVLAGAWCARRLGLRLEGHGVRYPWLLGLGMAFAVAVYVVLLDAFVFRQLLLPAYVDTFRLPLASRLLYFMIRAFNENVFYRLFVFTVLAAGAAALLRQPRPSFAVAFGLMIVTQLINIWPNVVLGSGEPWTAALLAYDGLRYVVPGVLWGCLFWRYGFLVAEVASVGCHLFLQPALGLLLA